MSILGPGSLPALGLAGSAAATNQQRLPELADRDKADQAARKLQADELRLANRDLDDSVETEFSHGQVSDRDSDGRLPWQQGDRGPDEEERPPDADRPRRQHDPQDECGQSLDVDV